MRSACESVQIEGRVQVDVLSLQIAIGVHDARVSISTLVAARSP
jgi:hypothetical protein